MRVYYITHYIYIALSLVNDVAVRIFNIGVNNMYLAGGFNETMANIYGAILCTAGTTATLLPYFAKKINNVRKNKDLLMMLGPTEIEKDNHPLLKPYACNNINCFYCKFLKQYFMKNCN